MPHVPSFALNRWRMDRRTNLDTLAQAHALVGEVDGPGRPLELGRPIAHSYITRLVAEFQGFTRDLHDLAAEVIARESNADVAYQSRLITSITEGRRIDQGNADLRSLANDYRRLGLTGLNGKVGASIGYWQRAGNRHRRGDAAYYGDLIRLRNCLAHGNQGQLLLLRTEGIPDTLTWARARIPALDRFSLALDRVTWDHLGIRNGAVVSAGLKVGDVVMVPWGLAPAKRARVVEVWGDPPAHVRVQLLPDAGVEEEDPVVILVAPSVLEAA